jgi:hypothetical protein
MRPWEHSFTSLYEIVAGKKKALADIGVSKGRNVPDGDANPQDLGNHLAPSAGKAFTLSSSS